MKMCERKHHRGWFGPGHCQNTESGGQERPETSATDKPPGASIAWHSYFIIITQDSHTLPNKTMAETER